MTTAPTAPPATTDLQIPFADCWITEQAQAAAQRVLASGWVTTGAECNLFEEEFASYVRADHAVAVSSCTVAIELALRSLRLDPGAAVLTSTMTFCGAVHAIEHAGLRPVLVDVDPTTGMPTPTTVARAVRSLDGRPAAMVLVHWAGDTFDREALAAAAGLPAERVVEDAAHALGAEHRGEVVGSGPTVCFSFYATKNLPIGEGGMVTTDDPERAAWMRRARLHGMSHDAWRRYLPGGTWRYDVVEPGLKANLTDLQAALGRAQLQSLSTWQARRARIAALYDLRLADLPTVQRPHRAHASTGRHAWHLYAVQLSDATVRDEVAEALARRGIGTSVHFIPVHRLTHFSSLLPPDGLPGADRMFDRLLSLPLYPRLTTHQVDDITDSLADALEGVER
jgi:dTDP-4-amino-4,6-dideoxygalactose transaminase